MAQQIDIIANIITKVDGAEAGINKLKNSLSQLKIPDGLDKNLTKSFANLDGIFERYRNQLNKGFKTKGDVSAFAKTGKELEAELDRVSKYMTELTGKKIDFKVNSEPIRQAQKDLANLIEQQQQLSNKALNFKVEGANGQSIESLLKGIRETAGNTKAGQAANAALANLQMGDVSGAKAKIEELIVAYGRLRDEKKKNAAVADSGLNILGAANAIKAQLDTATSGLQKVKTDADAAKASLEQMQGKQLGEAANQANKLAKDVQQVGASMNQANKSAQDFASSSFRMANQLDQLKSSTQYFFGLRNMINLLKQGFREALNTVKELDAAMTETAVVTKFDVGDMWEKLPEYTANANALGATVQDMYKSATLYYQQGLNAEQAMSIASETMKMARIGGLEAADATDMMTAALRGFNMELNEASAQRINDVYSNLAAKTASNTQELGEAMERTASIAHSAGMSFEGTSAFLAQMIETTREAPENLGTAMKTIIARFQELKKNPLEMQEVDGEEVSFNKVDAALQTIGVSLKNANGQFRELDQVFLDIAQHWNGLSQTQQRFIATTAAGSRQQSRFIAMMNNYDRTVQLMGYANDSAGASNEQFEKTMESMEAKLNKLKNAWDLFRMGLASNDMIKGTVDGLTKIVNGITKLIDTLSFGSDKIKSILTIFTAFTGLRMAGRGVNALIGGLGSMLDPTMSFKQGLFGGASGMRQTNNAAQAAMIYSPIVNALHEIRATMLGKNLTNTQQINPYDQYRQFTTARKNIGNLVRGGQAYNPDDITKQFRGLSQQQQSVLRQGAAATMYKVDSAMMQRYKATGSVAKDLRKAQGYYRNEAKAGTIAWEQYYNKISDPVAMKAALDKSPNVDKATYQFVDEMAKSTETQAKTNVRKAVEAGMLNNDKYSNVNVNTPTWERFVNQKAEQKWQEMSEEQRSAARVKAFKETNPAEPQKNNKFERGLEGFGKIGASISSAGIGLQTFGSLLMNSANPAVQTFGSIVTSTGSLLTGVGGLVSGLSSGLTALAGSEAMTAIATDVLGVSEASAATATMAMSAGLFLLVGAIAATVIGIKKHNENIKKAAEDVTKKYNEEKDKRQTNVNNLESYREDFARLRGGVDSNGMNVSLDTSDYSRYLEIVDTIAQLNPEIVDGYNAQGHAIINNNEALEKTLEHEKELQKQAVTDYTSKESTKALKQARDLAKVGKFIDESGEYDYGNKFLLSGRAAAKGGSEFKPQAEMRKQAQTIGNLLQEDWLKDKSILSDFGINPDDLAKGNDEAVKAFTNNFSKIQSRIDSAMDAAGDDIKDKTKESMLDAFSGFASASDELDELINPMYEQMSVKMAQSPLYNQIPEEMRTYFNQGLKDIVSDANVDDIDQAANDLATHFSAFTSEGSDYAKVMDQVAEAQDAYAASLDAGAYEQAANDATSAIEQMRQKLVDEGVDLETGYGKALSEFLDNEIAKIESFTEEGAANLSNALNTMTDEIAAAEGKLESFNAVAEGSNYSTAASNMAKIYEEATQDVHTAGEGDQTFWAGAEALVGRESLIGKSREEAQSLMKSVNEMVKGGQEGWDNFKIRWFDSVDAMGGKLVDKNGEIIQGITYDENGWFKTLDENINPEVYQQVADALHMSEESLVAMLNLGRQFGEVDFKNLDEARKAIATSDSVIAGRSVDKNGNRALYMKEETLNAELAQAGLDLNEQEQTKADLETEQNVKIISEAGKITADEFKDMGIKSMDSLIDVFDSTGQFTKDEMAEYAEQWAKLNDVEYDPTTFNEKFNEHLQELQDPEAVKQTSQLTDINSTTASILSVLASKRIEEGHLDAAQADNIKNSVLGGKGADTMAQLFSLGKNEKGKALTETEYKGTRDELVANQKALNDYLTKLNEGRDAAATQEEKDKFDAEIQSVTETLGYLNKYIQEGDAAWKAAQEKQEAEANKKKAEAEKQKEEAERQKQKAEDEKAKAEQAQTQAEQSKNNSTDKNVPEYASGDYWKNKEGEGPKYATLPPQTSTLLGEIANQGFADLFSSVTPESINTDTARQALESVYAASLETNGATLTQDLMNNLQTLGIDIQSAIDAGLVVDRNGIYTKANQEGQAAGEAATQGLEDGTESTDPPEIDVTSTADTIQQGIDTVVDNINNVVVPTITPPQPGDPNFVGPTLPNQTSNSPASDTSASKVVAAELTVENTDANSKLQETQTIAENVANIINQGATFVVNTSGTETLGKAATDAEKLSNASGATSMSVSANVSGASDVDNLKTSISGLSGKSITVSVGHRGLTASNIGTIKDKIDALKDKTITVTINKSGDGAHTGGYITSTGVIYRAKGGIAEHPDYSKKGTDRIPAYLTPGEYVQNRKAVQYFGIDFMRKINHKDLTGALQSFGSAAKGRYGRLGPNGKGGLTLTGEKGFEVAWIPSENRSMILGTDGPQMANLPSDTIIWNHKQSKKIIAQNAIPAGSHYVTSKGATRPSSSPASSSDSGNATKQFVDNAKKVGDDLSKKAQNTSEAITRVTVWWENAARRADSIQRKIDANQDEYQKYLKKLSATLHETGENGGNAFINENRKYIAEQELQYNKATAELGSMTTSAAKSKKGRKKQYKKGADNVIQVSYEGKKNKKGQAKTKTAYVDTSKYLTIDPDSGAYQINQQALKKIGNKKKRKAVADQLNKELNDRLAKQKAAEENIRKAQEAYEKFSEELYNTFFAWENELTKIWNITQKIEAILDRISRGDSMDSLLKAQIHSGLGDTEGYRKQMVSNFSSRVESQQEAIRQRRQAIDQSRIDLATKVAGQDVSQILAKVDEKLRGTLSENDRAGYQKYREELAEQQKVRTTANKYLTTETNASDGTIKINFDSAKFEEDRLAGLITNDMGKSIQDLVKELQDDSKNLNNLYKEQTEALTELYDTLEDLNKEQADMAAELLDINEEANKKEIEELQKLNDSIKQAMDDLLNEVKRKLDERRKLEENSKTERDISQKQQRLAMLRADTSGGHAVEIAQLEKEIQEAQSSYQQSLEDQLLDKLQNQADEASKQRERQIKLQEETLSSVNNIETVQKWMAAPEAFKDQIYERWREAKKYDQLTDVQQAEEDRNFLTNYSNLLSNGAKRGDVTKAIADNTVEEARRKEEDELELTNNEAVAKWEQTRNKLYAFGKVTTENWRQVEEAFNVTDTGWNNLTNEQRALTNFDKRDEILKGIKDNKIANFEQIIEQTNAELDQLDNQQLLINQQLEAAGSELNRAFQNVDAARTAYAAQLQAADQARARGVLIQPSNKYVLAAEAQVEKVQQRIRQLYKQLDGVFASRAQKQELIEQTQEQLKILKYKKGGIADFTGPAWLDGTPSKPELVLNATDTKNFIALKDVLSRAMSSVGHVENSYGGNANFEININVDHISNDYDVNKVVDQVEKRIVQKSGYRNVTQVRNFR